MGSNGNRCNCEESKKPLEARNWFVRDLKCNYSAFNGYRRTPSDYSSCICTACRASWRTKADYVYQLRMWPK